MELEGTPLIVITIISIGLVLGVGLFILGTFQTTVFTNSTDTSATQTILSESTATLTPIDTGITSSEVNANNQTYTDYDGVDDYINFSNTDVFNKTEFSIFLWFKSNNDTTQDTILDQTQNGGDSRGVIIRRLSGTPWDLDIQLQHNSSSKIRLKYDDFLDNLNWNSLGVVWNSSGDNGTSDNLKVYLNGEVFAPTVIQQDNLGSNTFYYNSPLKIGIQEGGFHPYNGSIDNFLLFNSSLSENEIIELNNYGINNNNIDTSNLFINYSRLEVNSSINPKFVVVNGSGILYAYDSIGNRVIKSDDDFTTYTTVYNLDSVLSNRSRDMFIDSRGTIFLSKRSGGFVFMSFGNDTNWTKPLAINTNCSADEWWGMAEDNNTDLYVGCYGSKPYVYKSSDAGISWSLIYNDTSEFGGDAIHIHNIRFNPYNNCTYIAIGDTASSSKITKTCDGGNTWEIVNNQTDQTGHVIAMLFTEDYNYFATDNHGVDGRGNGIWRTSLDTNEDVEYVLNFTNDNIGWAGSKDNAGNLYFGTVAGNLSGNESIYLYMSNNGVDWYDVYNNSNQETWGGITFITDFYNGSAYFINGSGVDILDNNIFKFNGIDFTNSQLWTKLNENNGTIAHDSVGSNDGTLIDGTTWATDGILVTLTAITDYTINPTTGLFTIVNDDYTWAELLASWEYGAITDDTGYDSMSSIRSGLAGFADWIALIVIVVAASIVLSIVLFNFKGGRNSI